jgi:hypothetical protein
MAQTCSKCSRANPPDAIYCYYDGFVLAGHSQNGGPVAVGSQPFAHPFVFPTGRHCRNFNELALACVEDWDAARDLLHQGYLENFLGGLGRIDLVLAAKEAAKFPDHDRGLDQFLDKLPSDTLGKPKLGVETQEINLGVVPVGTDRQFQVHLENQGLRLLYGTVSCADKAPWLTIGDTPNTLTKSVQFGTDLRVTVKVAPDRLRAGNKPLEGTLVVETNGGTATIKVRAEVPVKPFPPGVLGGAKSPREVAVKAKANHKEAAALFEDGTVAAWYKDNGWTYPVQGPSSSGIGAVQQFFEALGLTPPPKVSISDRKIHLRGNPGAPLRYTVKVETQEKRPVYAHGSSNQPWLEVGRARLTGRSATIHLSVPAVPNRPGETLTAQLVVQSNGNQRFVVPVTLQVSGQRNGAPVLEIEEVYSAPVVPVVPVEPVPVVAAVSPVVPVVAAAPPPVPAAPITPAAPMNVATAPLDFGAPPPGAPGAPRHVQRTGSSFGLLLHGIPAALLAFCLLLVLCWDVANRLIGGETNPGGPHFVGSDKDKDKDDPKDRDKALVPNTDPLIGVNFNSAHRFGIEMLKEEDPTVPGAKKRLTFKQEGGSNNTCVLIDGSGHLFGLPPGKGPGAPKKVYQNRPAWESTWDYTTEKVKVRQYVEIVPGEQSRRLDTCLVWYTVENYGTVPRTVGLRMMLDTFIGANDGVPFVIPGAQKGLLTDLRHFGEKEIPDYVEALEYPDLDKPGTVAHIGLKGISIPKVDLEPVHEMLICRWIASEMRWMPERKDIRSIEGEKELGEKGDSCVYIYWPTVPMPPKTTRHMAFTYGLGKMAASPTGGGSGKTQLALTSGGSFQPNGVFTVTAYVKGGKEGQKVKLQLPDGLAFAGDDDAEKHVDAPDPKAGYSQVSWRVKAGPTAGDYEVKATSAGVTARDKVTIKSGGIFGTN